MKIGDLVRVMPSAGKPNVEVGLIINTGYLCNNLCWIILIGDQEYMVPEWNVRLYNDAENR